MGIFVFSLTALAIGIVMHRRSCKTKVEQSDFFYTEYPINQ